MIGFTLRQLEYFVVAVEEGSITAAALRLHLSQSAMSAALSSLERSVGTQLLVRNQGRGLVLTDPGRELLERARRLLAEAHELANGAASHERSVSGSLTVASFSTIAPFIVPQVIVELARSHPEIDVDLAEAPTFEALERNLCDATCELAIAYDHGLPDYLVAEPLGEVAPHALLPRDHRLASEPAVSLAELASEPYVLFDIPQASAYMLSLFRAVGATPRIRHRTSSVALVHSLVAAGIGYSILNQRPAQLVSPDGVPFVARSFREPLPPLQVVLVYPNRLKLTARAAAFAETCRAVAAVAFAGVTAPVALAPGSR
jgi:DNA-binding transcriptional LysR family regulator